jgi:hypothetical protein
LPFKQSVQTLLKGKFLTSVAYYCPVPTGVPPALRGRETLKEKLKPYLQTVEWSE